MSTFLQEKVFYSVLTSKLRKNPPEMSVLRTKGEKHLIGTEGGGVSAPKRETCRKNSHCCTDSSFEMSVKRDLGQECVGKK